MANKSILHIINLNIPNIRLGHMFFFCCCLSIELTSDWNYPNKYDIPELLIVEPIRILSEVCPYLFLWEKINCTNEYNTFKPTIMGLIKIRVGTSNYKTSERNFIYHKLN